MVLSIIFLEDKHKIVLHLSIFYEYQQFFQHRICFSIQPQLQLVNLHRNQRYFVIKLHTWFCLSYFLKTNIKLYCIYQYFMSINSFFNTVSVSRYSHRHSNSGPPFFLIWSLPRLWYGSLSGSISLNHLSIFYNISCYNSLVLLTFVSRSSCRIISNTAAGPRNKS